MDRTTAAALPFLLRSACLTLLSVCLLMNGRATAASVGLFADEDLPQAAFAKQEIRSALASRGVGVDQFALSDLSRPVEDPRIVLALHSNTDVTRRLEAEGVTPPGQPTPEGFSIRATARDGRVTVWVIGGDAAGLMYGGLELAELIRTRGLDSVRDDDQSPYMAMRGVKFNIPLDVRTPSYTDPCDAAQKNIAEMWNLDFWKECIDRLARDRYNFVSLWNLHPFPSMVKVPDYPNVALDDVQRSTVAWNEYYSGNGTGFDAPEILADVETLKRMTIDEKIAFWREVMRYGKARNVTFYVVTWNIFTSGTGGKYGITDDIRNSTTADYFRKSVRQMFLTYPDLGGVGLTTGENMPGANFEEKENWALATYGRGVLDAAAVQPDRELTLIHRQHQTGAQDIARTFAPVIRQPNVEFLFSFKYAKAHVYSSTIQPYHEGFVKDIGRMKTLWTLRNDDVYYFRWGAPDFVREFLQNIPHDVSKGFYFGSDGYVWGREFLSVEPEQPRQLEIAKHWYHWMLWGRLGYDPTLTDQRLVAVLAARYPGVPAAELFDAWQEASMVYPVTTGFHWGSLDFQWYIEGCRSRPRPAQTESGFHDVNRFITLPPHPSTDNVSIAKFVAAVVEGKTPSGTTPPEVADKLDRHADRALKILDGLSPGSDKELRQTMEDIRAMALLGKYYAAKIRGATALALFRKTNDAAHQAAAVDQLNRAAGYWRRYASTALGQYRNPLWTNRVGYCDWRATFEDVLADVAIAGGKASPASMAPTPGGTILEAEAAKSAGFRKSAEIEGSTGDGYLAPSDGPGDRRTTWTFDTSDDAVYVLELRYALAGSDRFPVKVTVNGQDAGTITCWNTGGPTTWAWDRLPVTLRKGNNTIQVEFAGPLNVDHLNLLFGKADRASPKATPK